MLTKQEKLAPAWRDLRLCAPDIYGAARSPDDVRRALRKQLRELEGRPLSDDRATWWYTALGKILLKFEEAE